MPRVRTRTPAAIAALEQLPPDTRAAIAWAYDDSLAGFAAGDYGRIEVLDGERRSVVRRQLQAAARRRGRALRFRSGPGPLTFRVEVVPAVVKAAPVEETVGALRVGTRPPRRRPSAAERYDDVLPRWMRSGAQPGPRDKRRRR